MVSFYYDAKLMRKIDKYPKLSWYAWQCWVNPLLITCLYNIFFYNAGFIGSNNGPFTIQEMQLRGKAQGSSWTLGSLGGALGFLTSRTFWQFWHLGNLGSVDLLAIWILDLLGHFDILWSHWWFKLLGNLFLSFLGKLLNFWCFGIFDSSISSWMEFQLLATNFIFAQLDDRTN